MLLFVAVSVILLLYFFYYSNPYTYWTNLGIKQCTQDIWRTLLHHHSFPEMLTNFYNSHANIRFVGIYQFGKPILMLKDPELIKKIAVKDFDHFIDHQVMIQEGRYPQWDRSVFALKGENWRKMRATLTPVFSSSKVKTLMSLIEEHVQEYVEYFHSQDEEIITINCKDTFKKFCADTIMSTLFGVKCNSLKQPDNEFYRNFCRFTYVKTFWSTVKVLTSRMLPKSCSFLKYHLIAPELVDSSEAFIKENIDSRQKRGIVRHDIINLLLEVQKDTNSTLKITNDDISGQLLIFFLASFEAESSLFAFMLYELGVNPDIQERLKKEIVDSLRANDDKITYELVKSMKYMNMVVLETLRKWPPSLTANRVCTKPYTIEPELPGEKPVLVPKNTIIWLPIFPLHRDPIHFPDPEKFDPERFGDENRPQVSPYVYIPFGAGPRTCIGARVAILKAKLIFVHILLNFKIVPVEKTQIPLVICKRSIHLAAEEIVMGLKRVNQETILTKTRKTVYTG